MRWPLLLALGTGLAVPVLLTWLGVSRWLGAHPFWDVKIALIGAPLGCLAGLALVWAGRRAGLIVGIVWLGAAGAAVLYGKTRFVASYAEDILAGKLWYFGWIGIAAGLSLVLVAALAPHRRG